jgi:hypothetical protein
MKFCKKCNIEKEYKLFPIRNDSKDGYRNECIDCTKIYRDSKNYVYKSSYTTEEKRNYSKEYNIKNKEKISIRNKEYYIENKDYICNREKENRNAEYQSDYHKKYRVEKRESLREYRREYENYKRKTDPLYKLSTNIRSSIKIHLNKAGYLKESKTELILGCNFDELKNYLESKFEDWMTWTNHGLYDGTFNHGWDIDHIIPISSAKTEDDIIILNHYSNLQPLCSKINRDIKRDKLEYEHV